MNLNSETPATPQWPVERFFHRLSAWGAELSALDICVISVLLVFGVIVRWTDSIVAGMFDIVEVLIVLVGAYAFVYCETQNGHTKADIITNRLSSRARNRCEVVTTFLSLCFWFVLLCAGWRMLVRMFYEGETTELLKINIVPFRALWVFGLLLMCFLLLFKLFHHIGDLFSVDQRLSKGN